jgi:predicted Fe-Mo cluster-binding NifX family protein
VSKVVISIKAGDDLTAQLDPHFGRAARFLLVEADSRQVIEARDNRGVDDAHGAGIGAANLVHELGAVAAISGRFGPKAHDALRALGIAMYQVPEGLTAGDALERLAAGQLQPFEVKVL